MVPAPPSGFLLKVTSTEQKPSQILCCKWRVPLICSDPCFSPSDHWTEFTDSWSYRCTLIHNVILAFVRLFVWQLFPALACQGLSTLELCQFCSPLNLTLSTLPGTYSTFIKYLNEKWKYKHIELWLHLDMRWCPFLLSRGVGVWFSVCVHQEPQGFRQRTHF